MKKTFHAYVSGRVQGVCFRMYTQQQARLLGVSGWVRNLRDGRVEIMASGEEQSLVTLQNWLKKGPDMAKVISVELDYIEPQVHDGFSIR